MAGQGAAADSRWDHLLERLDGRIDHMAQVFLNQVGDLPDYRDGRVAEADLRRTATGTFTMLVEALRSGGQDAEDHLLAAATDLGPRRARAGIPLDSLLSAVRLDFTIAWAELMDLAGTRDAAVLAQHALDVWHVVDRYTQRLHEHYLEERVQMAQEESGARHEFVARLFAPEPLSAADLARIGTALALNPTATLQVAAGTGATATTLRALVTRARRRPPVDLYEAAGHVYVLGRDLGPHVNGVACGLVRDVPGLAGVRPAAALAAALARVATERDTAPLDVTTAWHLLARAELTRAGLDLGAYLDRALAACREPERERLVETARTYLATGSVSDTAATLFCHRNTILNRMARFTQLTGLDLTVPAQAARVHVAWSPRTPSP
ncbi:helix-turn-helix domain-containing protein [Micrococcales bacterium 31B]|nr:helix-turn-helix domain-containing protein [Micrococcales bacterium 31B]